MAQWKGIRQAGTMTMIFLGLLVGLKFFEQTWLSGTFTDPILVGVALVPFLFYLAMTGQLKRFSGGGFEVELQDQARKIVSPGSKIRFDPARLDPKRRESQLEEIKENAPTALTFELGREDFYETNVIKDYLEALGTLRYVVFTDADGQFEGYAPVDAFSRLLENNDIIVDEIETGEITNRAIVRTNTISRDSTNEECLRKMDDRDVDELAVIEGKRFVGVVTQDAIIRTLLSSALSEV